VQETRGLLEAAQAEQRAGGTAVGAMDLEVRTLRLEHQASVAHLTGLAEGCAREGERVQGALHRAEAAEAASRAEAAEARAEVARADAQADALEKEIVGLQEELSAALVTPVDPFITSPAPAPAPAPARCQGAAA